MRDHALWQPGRVAYDVLFAGLAVADLEVSAAWFEALLGRPADILPNDDEAMWKIVEGGWLYLVRDPVLAGGGRVTIAVPDLAVALTELTGRGLLPGQVEPVGEAGIHSILTDPDGNTVNFIEVSGQDG